jgi:predicted secreted protein
MAKLGFGTVLAVADIATGLVFATIAQITSITPFNVTREAHDTTSMDITDGYKTVLGGLKDSGECAIEVNYEPDVHNTLLADFDAENPMKYRVTFPTGDVASFDGVQTGFSPSAPMEDKMSASITIKISGKIVWT